MERFLRYSLERNRPIRLIVLLPEGRMRQMTAVVEAMEGSNVALYVIRPPERLCIKIADILSAGYLPRDDGQ